MTDTGLSQVQTQQFEIGPVRGAAELEIELSGTADIEAEAVLGGYLRLVDAEARRVGMSRVIVNLTRLSFMNSSCFKAFIHWIDGVQRTTVLNRYQIRLVSDPHHHWQKRSLDALRRMAPDTVSVQINREPSP